MEKFKNVLYEKSFKFAIKIINIYKNLVEDRKEYTLSKQLLKSATSIGANVSESERAQGKKDFVTKLYIALKEASETEYWIKLLVETDFIERQLGQDLLNDLEEIIKIINASIVTTKRGMAKT